MRGVDIPLEPFQGILSENRKEAHRATQTMQPCSVMVSCLLLMRPLRVRARRDRWHEETWLEA